MLRCDIHNDFISVKTTEAQPKANPYNDNSCILYALDVKFELMQII